MHIRRYNYKRKSATDICLCQCSRTVSQFTGLCHPSPGPLVETLQYLASDFKNRALSVAYRFRKDEARTREFGASTYPEYKMGNMAQAQGQSTVCNRARRNMHPSPMFVPYGLVISCDIGSATGTSCNQLETSFNVALLFTTVQLVTFKHSSSVDDAVSILLAVVERHTDLVARRRLSKSSSEALGA